NPIAMDSKPSEPRPPSEGSPAPPNDMSKRVLDVGQSSACQPMRIRVDEWAGSFEGQLREKLEIAIDPVLRQLDALLSHAQNTIAVMVASNTASSGLGQNQSAPLETSRGD